MFPYRKKAPGSIPKNMHPHDYPQISNDQESPEEVVYVSIWMLSLAFFFGGGVSLTYRTQVWFWGHEFWGWPWSSTHSVKLGIAAGSVPRISTSWPAPVWPNFQRFLVASKSRSLSSAGSYVADPCPLLLTLLVSGDFNNSVELRRSSTWLTPPRRMGDFKRYMASCEHLLGHQSSPVFWNRMFLVIQWP